MASCQKKDSASLDMYTYSIDKVIADLKSSGFSKLPSIRHLIKKNKYFDMYKDERVLSTYRENSIAHLNLIKDMDLESLFDALYAHGKELKLRVKREDKYFISRYVKNGEVSEGFRGHFDSHFITIVLPVCIPDGGERFTNGELFVMPNFRGHVSNEAINIFQKIYSKMLNNEKTYLDLLKIGKASLLDFKDYEPFVFYGNRTFHGNFPLLKSNSDRLTFICHLYDTSPRFGIGALLRKLRNR